MQDLECSCGNKVSETNDTIKECYWGDKHPFYICEKCGNEWDIQSKDELVKELQDQNTKLVNALTHAVEISEDVVSGNWDDVMEYRELLQDLTKTNKIRRPER